MMADAQPLGECGATPHGAPWCYSRTMPGYPIKRTCRAALALADASDNGSVIALPRLDQQRTGLSVSEWHKLSPGKARPNNSKTVAVALNIPF